MAEQKPTVVLIHGLWMTPLSWEHWVERFSAKGYAVKTPAWPGFDRPVEEIRADTSAIENLGLEEIIDHMDEAISEFKEFPERSHYTVGQEGWEEVADYAIDWAQAQLDVAPAAA